MAPTWNGHKPGMSDQRCFSAPEMVSCGSTFSSHPHVVVLLHSGAEYQALLGIPSKIELFAFAVPWFDEGEYDVNELSISGRGLFAFIFYVGEDVEELERYEQS